MVAAAVEPERLVFVDECGTHTSMAPIYGYAPEGERLRLSVPRRRGKNATLLASMSSGGMEPSIAVEGATTAVVFEAYVEWMLAPCLHPEGVVMDNLGAHRPRRIRELIEGRGCELLYLPFYSPDYNPIEEAFAKIKHILRRSAARTRATLVEAIEAALSAVSTQDVGGYFEHAGYRPTAHLLRNTLLRLSLANGLGSQPQRDVGWLQRLSVHQPLVEPLLHCFAVVIPPLSVKRNAHVSVCRWQLRAHLWIYFGDRFFVYRCIWDEVGEPMVVLCGYAVGDQFHRLLFLGRSFRNYQVVGGLQVLIPLNLDWSSCVDLLLYSPIPSRGKCHRTISELLL